MEGDSIMDETAMFSITYGLFLAGVESDGKKNACIINTAAQATAEPNGMVVTMLKTNLTTQLIKKKGSMTISVISRDCSLDTIKDFGMRSGENCEKFQDLEYKTDQQGNPYLEKGMLAYMSLEVSSVLDLGTHLLFLGKVSEAEKIEEGNPMSYSDYRFLKSGGSFDSPAPVKEQEKNYICSICHYVYDGETPFEDLPEDYVCPICGRPKSSFFQE